MKSDNHIEKLYTVSEVSELTSVTIRTIRHYDNIGILSPSSHGSAGSRLYNNMDIMRLQEILTLKLIGFSLKEINEIVEGNNREDFYITLNDQEEALRKKVDNINKVISIIEDAKKTFDYKESDWIKFTNIIKAVKATDISVKQYKNSNNLAKRINLHEGFSTNKEIGWYEWCYEKMNLKGNMKILEVGCGNGRLWKKNMQRIKSNLDITLTDIEDKMIEATKEELWDKKEMFKFDVVDVCNLPYENESFDVIIANHMLYHVKDIEKGLEEIYRVLKDDGSLFISTVGQDHLKELKLMIEDIDLGKTKEQWSFLDRFNLESGFEKLNKSFKDVYRYKYDDNLFVTEIEPIVSYIHSMENSESLVFEGKKLNALKKVLKEEIKAKKGIFIGKEIGILVAKK